MQVTDFKENSPGRLVATVHGATAFVPDPLPPSLAVGGELLELLLSAEHALGRLNGASRDLVNPMLVGSPLLRREAILSSRIEGTITSAEDLILFEAGSPPDGGARATSAHEVANYVRAMRHGISRLPELPVSLRLIRELHEQLLRNVRSEDQTPGEFRTSQNYIAPRANAPISEARFVPPPAQEMAQALSDFEKYLHGEPSGRERAPELMRLAFIHYQFEAIHPFRDGNGRVGRLITPLLMLSSSKLDQPLLYTSSYFDRHRSEYYDHLLDVSQRGAWDPWVRFFLRGIFESAVESVAVIERLLQLRDQWHAIYHKARSSALLLRLIDELFKNPWITMGAAAEILQVTHASASMNIKKLVADGILVEQTGRKWGQIFVAKDILGVMSSDGTSRITP